MELHGREQQQLQRALLAAFRRPEELAALVTFGLDQNLYAITEGGTLENRAFSLIEWATAHGRLADLVRCAHQQNPGNALLRDFVAQNLGEAALEPTPPVALPDMAHVVVTPSGATASGNRPAESPLRVVPVAPAMGPPNSRLPLSLLGGLGGLLIVVLGGWVLLQAVLGGPGTPTPAVVPTLVLTLVPTAVSAVAPTLMPTLVPTIMPTVGATLVPTLPVATRPQGRIAFTSRRGNGRDDIYVMDLTIPTPVRLTYGFADDYHPSWSPDGRQIAFTSDQGGTLGIYVMGSVGGTPTSVATFTVGSPESNLTWSPDGQQLVFAQIIKDVSTLFILDIQGGTSRAIDIKTPGNKTDPAWSLDGTRLAFTLTGGGQSAIYKVNIDGGGLTQLTTDIGVTYKEGKTWSPDSKRIVYSYSSEAHDSGKSEIYMMNADGTKTVNLTNNPANDHWPAWSPDGRWIAFASDRDNSNNYDIYILDVQDPTHAVTRITDGSWNAHPAWMPTQRP